MSFTVIIIIVSAIIPIALTLFIWKTVIGGLRGEQQESERLLQVGIPAQARVLGLQHTGSSVAVMGHRHLRLVVALEVHPQGQQPYQTQIQPLVSELYISSLQPGAFVQVRIDPHNPHKIALAGPSAAPMPMQQPQMPMMAPMHMPMGMAPGMGGQNFGRARRFMIIMMLVTTVPVTAILLAVFVDWSAVFGDDDAPKGGYCKAAARCCKTVSGGIADSACDNLKNLPGVGCKSAYENYQRSAKSLGKKCK